MEDHDNVDHEKVFCFGRFTSSPSLSLSLVEVEELEAVVLVVASFDQLSLYLFWERILNSFRTPST